jgi:hypothetical protein
MSIHRVALAALGGKSAPSRLPSGAIAVTAVCLLASLVSPLPAEWSATLPQFTACTPSSPPHIPERWQAVGLMMPFEQGQVDIGKLGFDRALPAMRATVYGLESGAVDLLITADETYVLHGPAQAPTGCLARRETARNGWPRHRTALADLHSARISGGKNLVSISHDSGSRRTPACHGEAGFCGAPSIRRVSAIMP